MFLNARQMQILEEIIFTEYMLLSKLSEQYTVSRQTVYEDAEVLSAWLRMQSMGKIKIEKGVIYLKAESKSAILEKIFLERQRWNFFSKEMRRSWLVYQIIFKTNITVEGMAESIKVSKSTVISDMKAIRKQFAGYGLTIVHKRNRYFVCGNEFNIRKTALNILSEYIDYFAYEEDVRILQNWLAKEIPPGTYSLLSRDMLALTLALINKRTSEGYMVNQPGIQSSFKTPEEQKLLEKMKSVMNINAFNDNEIEYIVDVLHAFIKLESSSTRMDRIKTITSYSLFKFQMLFTHTNGTEHFIQSLEEHFLSALYRIDLGIVLHNPLIKKITHQYNYVYIFSEMLLLECFPELENNSTILQHESGYLTLIFLTQLNTHQVISRTKKILVVCYEGIASSKLLASQLEQLSLDIEIVAATSCDNIDKYQNVDAVVTTMRFIDSEVPVLYVQSILTDLDRKKLYSFFNYTIMEDLSVDKVLKVVRDQVDDLTFEKIFKLLLQQHTETMLAEKGDENPMLKDLLTDEYIQIYPSVKTWDEALDVVAKPLLDNKKIEYRYVEKIKNNLNDFGAYIILREGFALPHARPEDGVLDLGMSMLILREPVIFDNEEIYVIVMIAALDAQKHLVALSQLVDCIAEDENFNRIKNTKDKQSLIHLVENK